MEKSFSYKIVILIVSGLLFLLIGNGILLGIMSSIGIDITNLAEFEKAVSENENSYLAQLAMGINHLLIFVGTAVLYRWWVTKDSFKSYFGLTELPEFKLFGLIFLLLIASYPIVGVSGLIFEYIELPQWMQSMDDDYAAVIEGMFGRNDVISYLLNILIIALLPAVGEELIFRGIIQKELHGVLNNPHLVIFITSVLFSAIHLQVEGFFPKFIISYVLCYSYWWTKSLWAPIALHFFNNASMATAFFFAKEELTALDQPENLQFPWLGFGISLFLCGWLIQNILTEQTKKIS